MATPAPHPAVIELAKKVIASDNQRIWYDVPNNVNITVFVSALRHQLKKQIGSVEIKTETNGRRIYIIKRTK